MKLKSFLLLLAISIIGVAGLSLLSSAGNVVKFRPNIYEFSNDTIAQTANGTFAIPEQNKSRSGVGFQIRATQLSGTIGSSAIVQESFWEDADYWYNRDTVAITAAGIYKWEDTTRAPWIRLYILADSTTQSGLYQVAAAAVADF